MLDFDTNQSKAEINPEFFQSLRKLTWKNSETKDFYKRTENLFGFFAFEEQGMKENSFILRQKRVIWFFAGCAAVNNGRNTINIEDIILAYRTLFKVIETDLSKLI